MHSSPYTRLGSSASEPKKSLSLTVSFYSIIVLTVTYNGTREMVPVLVATVSVSVELFSMTAERGASNRNVHSIAPEEKSYS